MTTISAPAATGKYDRIVSCTGTTTVRDLILDGNRDGRDSPAWDGAYNLEQSACLFLRDGTFDVDRVTVQNSPGDGIHITRNAVVNLQDITADACFRGAVTITGGNTTVVADNIQAASGATPCQFQIEVDSLGDGDSKVVDLTLTNSHFAWGEFESHGDLDVSDVTLDDGLWLGGPRTGGGGTVQFTDCTIGLVDAAFRRMLYWPTDVTFTRCDFTGAGLELYPQVLGFEVQGSVSFVDCTFVGTGAAAVYNYGNSTEPGLAVSFSGCTFSGFSAGYVLRGGYHDQLTGSLDPA